MTLREFDLLRAVYASNDRLPPGVTLPPGDDMAGIAIGGETLLAAVDQVIAGRHFLPDTDPRLVGRKVVARNVSDVAAMAGRPVATLAACALPADYGLARATALFEGLRDAAAAFGCPVIGGDTSIHADPAAPLVVSVTILGLSAWPGARVLTRRGGRVGDRVYVTGEVGGSLAADGGGRHLTFVPRVAEAQALLGQLGDRLRAMIDVSDGLGRDAGHLVEHDPSLAIELDAERIPTAGGMPWERAIGDGEDYELLFIADGDVPSEVAGTRVTTIGRVVARTAGAVVARVGAGEAARCVDVADRGWEHAGR